MVLFAGALVSSHAEAPTAESRFTVTLPPAPFATNLLADSPFGINTAFEPDTPDLDARLDAMQNAGIKWGRQDFTWKRIERRSREYEWASYDRLVEKCRQRGIMIFGDLAYAPDFHDPRTPEGVEAYCAFARAAAARYRGKVGYWQIWNEPNGGYYAYAWMTRMLEGKRWVRNDAFGPDIYAAVFTDDAKGEDTMVAWSPKPFAYVRVNNTGRGLTFYDIFGTRREASYDRVRTRSLPVPLGESPIYIVGPTGLKAAVRPDPGW